MGFTSPPPPPDRVASILWQLSVTLKTGQTPDLTAFSTIPADEQLHWRTLAVVAISMIHPDLMPPTPTPPATPPPTTPPATT